MVSSHRNTAAIEVLKRQFNCHEPFNVFRALKFRASQFAGSRPTDGEINSHFRRVAKMVHPDKIKVTSEYSFQQVSFARDALVEFGAWRPHDVLRAIRIYRCEDPPEGDTHCGMSSSEPVGPRSPPQGDSSSHVRDRSPVRGVPERCRRPYSYIDLTRNTAKKKA
ncbi:hypothetical protein GQX73_g10265 [Xylaria multiplex]|uniref:J domain-containing protein n=1 Tax=Xylaria multiplex TaxID=323545 RepID=A0A7C8MFL5_9PEZI|nr:hypothetical protein GQX73_g10265 [Xylaria multiplex]